MNGVYDLSLEELRRLHQKCLDNDCTAAAEMCARAIKRKMEPEPQPINQQVA
jgi:hypothetical protein